MSRAGLVALVAANLFVTFEALHHQWGYYNVILVYWGEAVILGFFNVLRMLVVGVAGEPLGPWLAEWVDFGHALNRFLLTAVGVALFVVKFFGFAFLIGLFVVLLPAYLTPEGESGARAIHKALLAAGPGAVLSLAALFLSHGVSFVRNFLVGREYQRVNILGLLFWPYARMGLVGAMLLAGIAIARAVPGLAAGTAFVVVMTLLKLAFDALSHVVERGLFAPRPVSTMSVAPPVVAAPPA